jgi:hypothetical protein
MTVTQEQLDFIVKTKERYRSTARGLSWEEKIASIEKMRDAAKKARESMKVVQTQSVPQNP